MLCSCGCGLMLRMHAMNLFIVGCDHRRVRAVTRLFSLVALIRLAFTSDWDVIALPSFLFFPLLFFLFFVPY